MINKKILLFIIILISLFGCSKNIKLLNGVKHLGNSTIRFVTEDNKVLYVDPISIKNFNSDADLIFITHTHSDHLEMSSINKLKKQTTKLVITADGLNKAKKYINESNIVIIEPDKEYNIEGISFKTTPSYTVSTSNHPRQMNWVGYIFFLNNSSYYISGDTEFIPEMKKIKADVAFLPISGGGYQMDVDQAIKAVNVIKPKIAVPIDPRGKIRDQYSFIDKLPKEIIGVVYENGKIKKVK